jgi:hypothetical protein
MNGKVAAVSFATMPSPPRSADDYRRKVAAYTRTIAGRGDAEPHAGARVVVVPPAASLKRGFDRARALLASGPVRLVAHGATLEARWPAWVRASPPASNLQLTELGAYRLMTNGEANEPLRKAVQAWLGEIFGDAFPGAGQVFSASCETRFFIAPLRERAIVEGLAACHAGDAVECVDASWSGWGIFRDLIGKPLPRRRADELTWAPVFLGSVAAAFGGTAVRLARSYVASRPSFARIEGEAKRARPREASPRLWAAVIPDLERVNRHVLASVVAPAREHGRRVGLLMIASIEAGERSETDLRTRISDVLWGGLRDVGREGAVDEVDQLVAPDDPLAFASDVARALGRSVRVALRVAARPPYVREAVVSHPLRPHAIELAKLVTLDLARAVLADDATRRAVARRSFDGATVFFVGCAFPSGAAANRVLQAAGATTVEFFHGAGADVPLDSGASLHCVWTETDVLAFEALGAKAVSAGMPRRTVTRARRRPVTHVLVMTNYCHRDDLESGVWPLEPFQHEILRVPELLAAERPGLRFRWRPHPSDGKAPIAREHAELANVDLSVGTALDDDLSWADLVVSSMSTTVFEALLTDVPVFMQVLPYLDGAPVLAPLAKERQFFRAEEVISRIVACLERLDRDDPDALRPERASRVALFGPTGEPTSIDARFFAGDARERSLRAAPFRKDRQDARDARAGKGG